MAGLLVVCGVGCEPERETTLEVLAALASCSVRFSDLSPRRRSWLARRVGTVGPARSAKAAVLAARSKTVGLAVWGHATVTSEYAREVLDLAAKKGVEAVVLASLSPAGSAIGSSARSLGWRRDEDDGWSVVPRGEVPAGAAERPVAAFDADAESLRVVLPGKRRA